MSENTEPKIHVTLAGERIEIILPGTGWSFQEAKLAKQVSEGMSPVEIEQRLGLADPDAWLAVLRVSYDRAELDFPSTRIGMEDVLDLAESVRKAVRAGADDLPPTSASESETVTPVASTESETESQS